MATLKRSSILLWFQDLFGLQSGAEAVPTQVSNLIQPVVEIGPKNTLVTKYNQGTATGTVTIYTTPADKDFYLTYASLSVTKDATNDGTDYFINITVQGIGHRLLRTFVQPTTAASFNRQLSFAHPIKLDRNTSIVLTGGFTAGTQTKSGDIGGYILE